ncbi:cupin domain-containing protein [Microbispora rosea]|uniref:cupin domain-containing protein n=1 Tax=Microbispora rosea TaxID=58117 RepID=UPI0009712864|nr:cupin domain-containing protein [Microbispora rosea]GIH46456.1 hypothetical protein Mro03_16350 [Microbispora rosea subsp. rosea]
MCHEYHHKQPGQDPQCHEVRISYARHAPRRHRLRPDGRGPGVVRERLGGTGHPGRRRGDHGDCGGYRLDPGHAHPLLHDLPGLIHLPARAAPTTGSQAATDAEADLGTLVALLGREITSPRPGTDAVVPALLDMLLLYILRAWASTAHPPSAGGRLMSSKFTSSKRS